MLRITLKKRPSHDDLTAFAFGVGLITGVTVYSVGLLAGYGATMSAATLLVTTILVTGWGVLRPTAFSWTYRKWNGLARRFVLFAQNYTMAVIFRIVFGTVAVAGARFERSARPDGSGWKPKTTPDISEQVGYAPPGGGAAGWGRRLRSWSRGTPNHWSLFLLPFLSLLDAFEGQTSARTAEDIYTLY